MHHHLRTILNLLSPALLFFCQDKVAEGTERPNIVLIVADDLGYGELGCQGNPEIPTPWIDSIASDGIRFTQGYVTASYCAPSRAGLMTGRYQTLFGFDRNPIGAINEDPTVGLPPDQLTIAELLQQGGYATGLVGKWHLGGTAPYHPIRHGFDEFFGFLHEGHYYAPMPNDGLVSWLRRKALPDGGMGLWSNADGSLYLSTEMGHHEPAYDADNPILRNGQPIVESEYLTDALSREAVSFIQRHADRPFFLYLAFNAVHSPMQALRKDVEAQGSIEDPQRRIFAGMLTRMDKAVGNVQQTLETLALAENTIVVFLSDHGGPTRELTSSNRPLRGGKGSLYEGGVRVPFMIKWPGVLPSGALEERPICSIDLMPTFASASGVNVPDEVHSNGLDLLPFLTGERNDRPHKDLAWVMGSKIAFRSGDWKLVGGTRNWLDRRWELYDLANDPSEEHDLALQRPEILESMIRKAAQALPRHPDPPRQIENPR